MKYYESYRKKDVISIIILLGILLTVPFINTSSREADNTGYQSLTFENQGYSDRAIASAQDAIKTPQKSLDYIKNEQNFLKNLTESNDVSLFQLGKRPSKIEQFQFGVLSGNYSVTRNKGGIAQLEAQSEVNENELKQVEDRAEFLTDYRSFWFIPFQRVEKIIDIQVNDKNSEIFVLKNAENKSVGKVTILSHQSGGMISLNFSETSYQ